MKLTQLHDIPGLTIDDKLQRIINNADGHRVWVQPKYNGIMGIWYNGDMWTRQGKKYKPGAFCEKFYAELSTVPHGVILYGELCIDGIPFQDAVGLLSVNRLPVGLDTHRFYVHDWFDTNIPVNEQPYSVRFVALQNYLAMTGSARAFTCGAESQLVTTAGQIKQAFNEMVSVKREGIVIRAEPAFICVTTDSPQIIKWKKTEDDEGICVSVYEGLGKLKGTLGGFVVRLKTGAHVNIGGGKGLNDTMRDRLWKNPPIDKAITFAYEMLSTDGVPLKPQFISVRNYE